MKKGISILKKKLQNGGKFTESISRIFLKKLLWHYY